VERLHRIGERALQAIAGEHELEALGLELGLVPRRRAC
jgi:hypothetical protein